MPSALSIAVFLGLSFSAALAQLSPEAPGPYAVGTRTVTVTGLLGGNSSVPLLLHYPATAAGANQPVNPVATPCPLVVFGHGFSLPADLYATLYTHWASRGYLVAAPTTESALFSGNLPKFIKDCEAAVIGLRAAAQTPGNVLNASVSATVRAVASGHSFGGAASLVAASERPDLFLAAAPMAATSTSPQGVDILGATAALSVPVLHLGASSDTVVPPAQNLDPLYAATPSSKVLIEIGGGAHSFFHEAWYIDRLTDGPALITVAQQQLLTRRYTTPFFDWVARGSTGILERLLGPSAHSDAGLSRCENVLQAPVLFDAGPAVSGQVYSVHPTWQAGDGVVFAVAAGPGSLSTPYGVVLVDLATATIVDAGLTGPNGYATLSATTPSGPPLSGTTLHSQALIFRPGGALLSNAITTAIP